MYMFTNHVEIPCCDHPRGLQEMLQDKTQYNQTSRCCSRHCHQHTHIAQTITIELTRTVITKLWHPPNTQDECPSSWLFTLPLVSQFWHVPFDLCRTGLTFWPLQDWADLLTSAGLGWPFDLCRTGLKFGCGTSNSVAVHAEKLHAQTSAVQKGCPMHLSSLRLLLTI